METKQQSSLWDSGLAATAWKDAIKKLHPALMVKNPVMFVVLIGSVLTSIAFLSDVVSANFGEALFSGQISLWLWFTVLFANFAEAMAEGRGKAQAESLRKARTETKAKVRLPDGKTKLIASSELKK